MTLIWLAVTVGTVWNGLRFTASQQHPLTWRHLFLSAVFTIFLTAANATTLACFGVYTLGNLSALTALEVLLSLVLYRKNFNVGKQFPAMFRSPLPKGLLCVLAAAAVLYLCFPTTYLSGGRDPGLYLINAVHISQTGSFQYASDPYMTRHYQELAGVARLDYPALYSAYEYGLSTDPGQVVPQFLPVLPSLLAVGYDLAGIAGAIRVPGIIGLCCLAAAYAMVKPMFGSRTATLAAAFLLLNPAQLWNARITQTELFCQLLLFVLFRILADGWQTRSRRAAWLAGLLLGFGTFVRIDTYLVGAGFLVFFLYELICRRPHASYLCPAVLAYTGLSVLSLLYGYFFSYPYFYDHWEAGVLNQVVLCNAALLVLALIAVLLLRLRPRTALPDLYRLAAEEPRRMKLFCWVLGVIFLLSYLVRPLFGPGDFNYHSSVEFCLYTSVLAIPLALFGMYHTFVGRAEEQERFLPFFCVGGSNLFVYLWRPSISPDHMWASRRWVTIALPFVLILAAYGIRCIRMVRRPLLRRKAQALCAGIVAVFMLRQCRGFLFTAMWDGIEDDYRTVAETLDDDTLYLTTNTETASVFRVIFHKNVRLLVNDDPEALLDYLEENGSLYYLGDSSDLDLLNVQCELLCEGQVGGKMLRETYGEIPDSWEDRTYTCNQYLVTLRSLEEEQPVELDRFFTTTGVSALTEEGIVGTGEKGCLLFGPYCTLLPGDYELRFALEGDSHAELTLEVVAANQDTLASTTVTGAQEICLSFSVTEPTTEIEFRLQLESPAQVTCTGVSIRQTDS